MRCRTHPRAHAQVRLRRRLLCFVASAAVIVSFGSSRPCGLRRRPTSLRTGASISRAAPCSPTTAATATTARLVNSPTWVAGKLGQALSFSTNRSVSVGNIPAINGVNRLSMSAWIKRGTSNALVLVGKQTKQPLTLPSRPGTTALSISNSAMGPTPVAGSASTTPIGIMSAFTFDGALAGNSNRLKGYVDGAQRTLTFSRDDPCDDHEQHHGFQHRQDDVRLLEWASRRCVDLRSCSEFGRDRRPGIDCCCRHDCADRAVWFDRHGAHIFASELVVDCLD